MPRYEWEMELIVEADDDVEAQARIEEALEEGYIDPDGVFSHGQMTKLES